jgi:AcrR family transcriptional regulator
MRRSELEPRKAPRQQRAQAMVALILQAATRVLARESLAGFNTNRVAEVAGISVGSLYQYFPNKAALVAALITRAQDEFAAQLHQCLHETQGMPLKQALHALARLSIAQQYASPVLAAALDHEEKRLPINDRLQAFGATLLELVSTLLARHASELPAPLPDAAAADCIVITKALVEADAEQGRAPAPDLEQRIVRALLGYLTLAPSVASVDPAAPPKRRRRSAAVS